MKLEFNDYLVYILCFIGSLVGTLLFIPKLIHVIKAKRLMDTPNERSSHSTKIPTLGGVAFYISFIGALYILRFYNHTDIEISYVVGLTIMLIIGLKDDLVSVSPYTKIATQFIAASIIFYDDNFVIHNLHGFLGISEISGLISAILIITFFIGLINSFNLIDGIDGLAGSIGFMIFFFYSIFFFILEKKFSFGISLTGMGVVLGFLHYNLSQKRMKIFMGDTGSLILGFIIAVLSNRLITIDTSAVQKLGILPENFVLVFGATLFVPIFDSLRVFTIRTIEHGNPFKADRRHAHHILLDYYKLSHRRTSFYITIYASIFTISVYILSVYFIWPLVLTYIVLNNFLLGMYLHHLKKKIETNLSLTEQ